ESFTYDNNGNRTNSGYQTGAGNRLLSGGGYSYHYDGEGNLIERDGGGVIRTFEWDNRNRVVKVADRVGRTVTQGVRDSYDALDRRIAKSVTLMPGSGTTHVTYFAYDRDNVLLELEIHGGLPVVTMRYLHGPGVDQVLAQDNGQVYWLLPDMLGSTRDLVDG